MNKIERAKLELPVVAPETKLLEPAKTATNSVDGTPSRKPSNAIPCSSKTAHYTCAPPKRNLMSSFQAASSVSASKRQQADVSSSAVPPVEHMVSRVEALLMPDSPLVAKVRLGSIHTVTFGPADYRYRPTRAGLYLHFALFAWGSSPSLYYSSLSTDGAELSISGPCPRFLLNPS